MLEGLDAIEWGKLEHAYGSAEDVPEILRAIAEGNESTDELFGNIWHQGTVYEATAYAVPFLIELVTNDTISLKVKENLLILLGLIAKGASYLAVHAGNDESSMAQFLRGQANFEEELTNEHKWVADAHNAVVKGVPAYLPFLTADETDIRLAAIYVMRHCEESAGLILPEIIKALERETHANTRAGLILTYGRLSETNAPSYPLIEAILNDPAEPLIVRCAAATELCRLSPSQAIEIATPVLVDSVLSIEMLEDDWHAVVFDESDITQILDECFSLLGGRTENERITAVLEKFDTVTSYDDISFLLISALMFGTPEDELSPPYPAVKLTPQQRFVLEKLTDSVNVWKYDIGGILKHYGLPDDPQGIANLLQRDRAIG